MSKVKSYFQKLYSYDSIKVLIFFVLSRLVIYSIGIVGAAGFTFNTIPALDQKSLSVENMSMNWDSNWYHIIADHGYARSNFNEKYESSWGFMPLYPVLIGGISDITGVAFFPVAFITSNIFSYLAILIFFKFFKKEIGDENKSKLEFIYLVVFSAGSFYLSIPYTESLYLFFTALVFLYSQKRNYLLSGLFIGLAVVTRVHGVALGLIPMAIAFMDAYKLYKEKKLKPAAYEIGKLILAGIIALIPLIIFMLYAREMTGNAEAVFDSQSAWQNPRPYPFKAFLGLYRFTDFVDPYIHFALWLIYGIIWIRLLKKIKPEFTLFAIGLLGISTSTGIFYGANRYVLPLVPILAAYLVKEKTGKWEIRLFEIANWVTAVIMIIAFATERSIAV